MLLLRFILWILGNSAALWVAVSTIPSISFSGQPEDWVAAGVILGITNLLLKPILKLLAGPFIIVTFGLALIAVQGVVLWITHIGLQTLTDAELLFKFPWGYIWGSLVVSAATVALSRLNRFITAPSPTNEVADDEIHEKLKTITKSVDELKRHHQQRNDGDDEWEDEDEEEDEEDENENDNWDDDNGDEDENDA